MEFSNLQIKDIEAVIRYSPHLKQWTAAHRHVHYVGIAFKGKALHTFKNQKFSVDENCVYFFNQKDHYKVLVTEFPVECFSIHFTTTEKIDTDSFCFPVSNPAYFESLLEKAAQAQKSGNFLEMYVAAYSICAEINRLRKKEYYKKDKRMIEAKEYIDTNFNNPDCLKAVIAKSGISSRRFGEVFRKVYDVTPNKYIISKKIEYAKNLLSTGSFTVTQVASICNFSDVYYFSKVFKATTGITPGKYK